MKMTIVVSVVLIGSMVSAYSDPEPSAETTNPVPSELKQAGVGLELIPSTKHELIKQFSVDDITYFVVIQTPITGSSELVLIEKKNGGQPEFVRGGTWGDILRATSKDIASREQDVPDSAKYAVASVLAAQEVDSRSVASLRSADESGKAMARLAEKVKEEEQNGRLDKYLKQAYQDQGLIGH